METDQVYEKFLRGELNLFSLVLTDENDTNPIKLSRRMLYRKVDEKSISILSWQNKEKAQVEAAKLKSLSSNNIELPYKVLIYEFGKDEYKSFYDAEQYRGHRLLLEIDTDLPST